MSIAKPLTFAALLLTLATSNLKAQNRERKVEIGLHYTGINLRSIDSTESGGGVRFSYNINDYLAVEGQGNLFEFAIGDHPTDDVLAAQGLFGVKAGVRSHRFGVFAKLRPGVANFPELRMLRGLCLLSPTCDRSGRSGNRFALDTGAVVEFYPTQRIIVRFDVGDTMIRFKNDSLFRGSSHVGIEDGMSHNFQFVAGVGFRF